MPEKKTTIIIFALLLIFFSTALSSWAVESVTILYTGDTDGRIIPVFQ